MNPILYTLKYGALSLIALSPLAEAELKVNASQTHSILYANMENQAVMRIKIVSDKKTAAVKTMRFGLIGDDSKRAAQNFKVFDSGSSPLFSPNAENESDRAIPANVTVKRQDKVITITGNIALEKGDNYLWLAIDTPHNVAGGTDFDVALRKMTATDPNVKINGADPKGSMSVYPFKQRIVPYFRSGWLKNAPADMLRASDMEMITDIIYFHLTCDANGNLKGGNDPKFLQDLAKIKELRGDNPVKIILGVAHSKDGFAATAADPAKRRLFAEQLKFYVDKRGFDGVDIDWEYPTDEKQWHDFGLLLGEIRHQFGANGKSISSAVLMYHNIPNRLVIDQLDFVNIMSYDRAGEHATMPQFIADDKTARKFMHPAKIILGLPYYSNDTSKPRDWNVQTPYSKIRRVQPDLKASDNTLTLDGKPHYFNGPDLIEKKSQYVHDNNLGGVMIWAYETDVPTSEESSLRRAMFKHIKRTKR